MLVLNAYISTINAQNAAIRQAELRAEEAKMYLRVAGLRGPENQILITLYGAGKLPIVIDYLIVEFVNGTYVESPVNQLTVNPGENITLTPSQLNPRLIAYDTDYWRADEGYLNSFGNNDHYSYPGIGNGLDKLHACP